MPSRPALITDHFSDAQLKLRERVDAIEDAEMELVDPEAASDTLAAELGLPLLRIRGWTGRKTRKAGAVGFVIQAELEPTSRLQTALSLRPSTGWMTPEPKWRLEQNMLYLDCEPSRMDEEKRRVEEAFASRNGEIEPKQNELRAWARHLIVMRQRDIAKEDEELKQLADAAGIRLTRRSDPRAAPIDLEKKQKIVLARRPPKPNAPPELVLTPAQLELVLTEMWRVGRQFEVAPETYGKLDEEDLRNIIVGLLNAVFDVGATVVGEAFRSKGKTDVLLQVTTGAVFVAECKWWGGEAKYVNALEQLFGYLTHRETEAALVAFVRVQDFSSVVEAARTAIGVHQTSTARPTLANDGRFTSTHQHPGDPSKRLNVHHMLFALPKRSR